MLHQAYWAILDIAELRRGGYSPTPHCVELSSEPAEGSGPHTAPPGTTAANLRWQIGHAWRRIWVTFYDYQLMSFLHSFCVWTCSGDRSEAQHFPIMNTTGSFSGHAEAIFQELSHNRQQLSDHCVPQDCSNHHHNS